MKVHLGEKNIFSKYLSSTIFKTHLEDEHVPRYRVDFSQYWLGEMGSGHIIMLSTINVWSIVFAMSRYLWRDAPK